MQERPWKEELYLPVQTRDHANKRIKFDETVKSILIVASQVITVCQTVRHNSMYKYWQNELIIVTFIPSIEIIKYITIAQIFSYQHISIINTKTMFDKLLNKLLQKMFVCLKGLKSKLS